MCGPLPSWVGLPTFLRLLLGVLIWFVGFAPLFPVLWSVGCWFVVYCMLLSAFVLGLFVMRCGWLGSAFWLGLLLRVSYVYLLLFIIVYKPFDFVCLMVFGFVVDFRFGYVCRLIFSVYNVWMFLFVWF